MYRQRLLYYYYIGLEGLAASAYNMRVRCPLRAAFARVQVQVVAAAWLNGSWQIYRFPNGDANLTSSHAALARSLFALGGILLLYEYMGYSGIYTCVLHTAAASSSSSSPLLFTFYDVFLFFSHLSPAFIVFFPKFRRPSHAHARIG